MTPKLNLVYSSQNNDNANIAGFGWDIDIPYIQTINRKGVEDMFDDFFFYSALDGELRSTDGSTTTEAYGPLVENGDFRKYEYENHTRWLVTDKFGTQYRFGSTTAARQDNPSDSAQIRTWMLEEVRDTNDNYIKYEYQKSNGQIYPYKITYTGHGTADGDFEIEFFYESRGDNATSTAPGFSVITNDRISEIQAKIDGAWTRKYELNYTTGDTGGRSLLQSITETGKDEFGSTISLPATLFDYSTSTAGWTYDSGYVLPIPFVDGNGEKGVRYADITGDGLVDLIYSVHHIPDGTEGKSVFINNSDGTGWSQDMNWTVPVHFYEQYNGADEGVRLADVNADGFADMLKGKSGTRDVYINNGDGTGWAYDSNWILPVDFVDNEKRDQGIRIADVNGDGLVDLLGGGSVYINDGDGTGWTVDVNYILPINFATTLGLNNGAQVDDINGDGFADIIVSYYHSIDHTQTKKVYINNGDGTGWTEDTSWNIPFFLVEKYYGYDKNATHIVDINGDGFPDAIQSAFHDPDNTEIKVVYLNNGDGTGWTEDTNWTIPVYFFEQYNQSDQGTRFADVNGDGLVDLMEGRGTAKNIYINNGI
ncbi:MAG: FG-GAP-like repeat-containing protein, partial [Anaerolineae bacterium]|nr:FG-GAP-like repeat-containing protein [Anaerolineae bacterium]